MAKRNGKNGQEDPEATASSPRLDRARFLQYYDIGEEEYDSTGILWEELERIYAHHAESTQELQAVATYIAERLRALPPVHSVKVRIKHPEHLLEKLIRKRLGRADFEASYETYTDRITDLIGLRAIHLFKGQWREIHDFVMGSWDLAEDPLAYIRKGDAEDIVEQFESCGCRVEEHPFGYRSVHYLLKSRPAKRVHIAELQVRTLFEEGWSEIDHQVRYPRRSRDKRLEEFLVIFNRLAGSADEMGTFVRSLSQTLQEHTMQLTETKAQLATKEAELNKTISKLAVSDAEKAKLRQQVEEFRSVAKSSRDYLGQAIGAPLISYPSTFTISASDIIFSYQERVCSKCGQIFKDHSLISTLTDNLCPKCRLSFP